MVDISGTGVGLKVLFGNIGGVVRLVDQDVIPGFIPGRPRFCHLLVPLVGAGKLGIEVKDEPTIVEQFVGNLLPDIKMR